jgi:adenylate cyclase
MAQEIERKFLLEDTPPHEQLGEGTPIRQGYLAEDNGVNVRVRITDKESVITIKGGDGLSRTEVEVPISAEEAESLWAFTAGRRLEKTRHRVSLGGHTAEVDIFAGALAGLRLVEVEFESEEEASVFQPPPWFGREVTGDYRWTNVSLSQHGRPD